MKRKIFAVLVLLLAEACAVAGMLLITYPIALNVRILDMVVLSVIIWLWGYDLFRPLVSLGKKHPTEVGSNGVRWVSAIIYTALAVTFAIVSIVCEIPLTFQILGHAVLVLLLILMLGGVSLSAGKIKEVGQAEDKKLQGVEEMRSAMRQLEDEMAMQHDVPEEVVRQVQACSEALRYVAPTNNQEAMQLEKQFVDIVRDMTIAISAYDRNASRIEQNMARMKRILENRKNTY